MKRRSLTLPRVAAVAVGPLFMLLTSCGTSTDFFQNQIAVRNGNVNLVFVNNTLFRASFSFGSYDALDRTPGEATLQQLRLEAGTTTGQTAIPCRRNVAIGTQEFINRVIATRGNRGANFDPETFSTQVLFSSAAADSDAAALPDAGTANGVDLLLGVHYSCADVVFITFQPDPDAPGGFRIDVAQIPDQITP